MIPGPKELAMVICAKERGGEVRLTSIPKYRPCSGEGRHKKSGALERAAQNCNNWVGPKRPSYFPCFAYQSALIGVKLFHFSGRSSSAKIAVTGQTGTQAPQSMHSVGWMYSCVSPSNAGSSLRG